MKVVLQGGEPNHFIDIAHHSPNFLKSLMLLLASISAPIIAPFKRHVLAERSQNIYDKSSVFLCREQLQNGSRDKPLQSRDHL